MNMLTKFGIGTVQWGLPYGLANHRGITTPVIVSKILIEAKRRGVAVLDTAPLYGRSEAVLGKSSIDQFKIVTKTQKFGTSHITDLEVCKLRATFQHSLEMLSCAKVYGLLIHQPEDIFVSGGDRLLKEMMKLKDEGVVEKIGVSVYDSFQVDEILKRFSPDLIQLPLSVLDQRMLASGHLDLLKDKGAEIHVRSVFLQGLLLMPQNEVPTFFNPIQPLLRRWHALSKAQGLSSTQAALAFVKNIPSVDKVVVGVDNLEQFRSVAEDFAMETNFDARGLTCNDINFVNPALWDI
jgi:aryl-alcohol dehydrogenase-like predicted oxidoreductase